MKKQQPNPNPNPKSSPNPRPKRRNSASPHASSSTPSENNPSSTQRKTQSKTENVTLEPIAVLEGERLHMNLHPGQKKAADSKARFTIVLAGTQSGKTCFTPLWLYLEMMRRGPGDYLVVGPTLQLLDKKSIPEFVKVFCRILDVGTYQASPGHVLHIHDEGARSLFGSDYDPLVPTRILFGYATDPESLESSTAKAAVLDEVGQKKFKIGSWQAIQRRLAFHRGRALITTSIYSWNWLKELAERAGHGDPDYQLIRFDSTTNPGFPKSEFERARRELPSWLFNMMYRGQFERPAGLIYDCVKPEHLRKRTALPEHWKRYIGLDFGPVNTAAVIVAEEPVPEVETDIDPYADTRPPWEHMDAAAKEEYYYAQIEREKKRVPPADPPTPYRVIEHIYKPGRRTVREHVAALKRLCPHPALVIGGSASENEWRSDFANAGLAVEKPPMQDVELGIQRVYAEFQKDKLVLFDDLVELRDELQTYGRVLDEQGKPLDEIEDKEDYHLLDALRVLFVELGETRPIGMFFPPPRRLNDPWAYQKF